MQWYDLKYFSAFIIPALAYMGISTGGMLSYAPLIFAFVMVPIVEQFLARPETNLDEDQASLKSHNVLFDIILFLNIPIIYFLIFLLGKNLLHAQYSSFELTGLTLSLGLVLGSCGINVAHELGHKQAWYSKLGSWLLLLPSHYLHFYIEHNRGHHKYVATPLDPATARKGESLYRFWIRSVLGSYISAWKLEAKRVRLSNSNTGFLKNQMLIFSLTQFLFYILLYVLFGFKITLLLCLAGIISFLFLETINYIEHYGLVRRKLNNGRYERVQPWHSWNSNHVLGRIILYELTRHSDHHYLANKKYQLLDHHDSSPQLPLGYPASMLLSMFPPFWFRIMNKRVESFSQLS